MSIFSSTTKPGFSNFPGVSTKPIQSPSTSQKKTTESAKNHLRQSNIAKKDSLNIPLNQQIAFGLSMATLATSALSHAGCPLPSDTVKILGLAFQAASAFTIVQNSFKEPLTKTVFSLASLGLTYTHLGPFMQGMSTYSMCYDSYQQSLKSLKSRNDKNGWTVGRNLLVYTTNALHAGYNFSKLLPSQPSTPSPRPSPSPSPRPSKPMGSSLIPFDFDESTNETCHPDSGLICAAYEVLSNRPLALPMPVPKFDASSLLSLSYDEITARINFADFSKLPKETQKAKDNSVKAYKKLFQPVKKPLPTPLDRNNMCIEADRRPETLINTFIEILLDPKEPINKSIISKIDNAVTKRIAYINAKIDIAPLVRYIKDNLPRQLSPPISQLLKRELAKFQKNHPDATLDDTHVRRIVEGIFAPSIEKLSKESDPQSRELVEAMNKALRTTSDTVVDLVSG